METCGQSPWVSRWFESKGHEVVVANARELQAITQSRRKNDRRDAKKLAQLARADVELLHPVRHRCEQQQADLTAIRARAVLVEARTTFINSVRGMVKAFGYKLPSCASGNFAVRALQHMPSILRQRLEPLIEQIESISQTIELYDEQIRQLAETAYPETRFLRQVSGVAHLTALTYVLTIGDAARFASSRDVGSYLGLTPARRQSGDSDPQCGISKEGDRYLRKLLVQSAQHIIGRFGRDCDLRRWALAKITSNKSSKKIQVVAVARKLAVLLHRLWADGAAYQAFRHPAATQAA
jgi:transposase